MGIFSRAKQAKREIFQTFDKETVAKSFADFIALDESLSALSSEPFTGAVALKAKVDAYLALSDQATELKLISKNIADVPTESAQKACEAMVGKLGPVPVLLDFGMVKRLSERHKLAFCAMVRRMNRQFIGN